MDFGGRRNDEACAGGRIGLLTCKSRLSGRQDVKVLLPRKELKKFGQSGLVKLLPRLVSKGRGRGTLVEAGAVMTVPVEEAELLNGAVAVEGKGVAVVE